MGINVSVSTRRDLLKAMGGLALGLTAPSCGRREQRDAGQVGATTTDVTLRGSDLEVGVLYEEGPWYDMTAALGEQLERDVPGTRIRHTFANSASDANRALRWEAGDPLDIDTGRWNNQARTTWDWVDKGFLLDLTPHLEEALPSGERWLDIYHPITHSFATDQRPGSPTNGKWFAVPQELVLMLIHYNKRAFDEMGVGPASTWPEFLELCATIDEKGRDRGMKPIAVSGPTAPYMAQWYDRMIQRVAGRSALEDVVFGNARAVDNPAFLESARELEKIFRNAWLMEGYRGADFTAAQALFFQGKAAMIHMGTWLLSEMADVIPDDFVIGAFDFPSVPGGLGKQTSMFGTTTAWSIPNPEKATSHRVNVPLALEYLKRFCGREHLARRARELGNISPCTKTPPPPRLPGVDRLIGRAAEIDASSAAQGELIVFYYGVLWDAALSNAWWPPMQALWLGKVNAEQMVEQIDQNLDKYRAISRHP